MSDVEVFIAACALLIVGVALFSIAYCAWRAGAWAWREYHAKKRRGGYIELQPTPDRPRLGVSQTRGGAAPTARRTTRRSSPSWQPKR
jgi:hypothetical protein